MRKLDPIDSFLIELVVFKETINVLKEISTAVFPIIINETQVQTLLKVQRFPYIVLLIYPIAFLFEKLDSLALCLLINHQKLFLDVV